MTPEELAQAFPIGVLQRALKIKEDEDEMHKN